MAGFRTIRRAVAACLLVALPAATQAARAGEVVVFAAASLKDVLQEAARAWEAESGGRAVISAAGSSVLARQIELGAPADLFVSASTDWMDTLERAGLIRPGTRRDLAGNRLVLIAHGRGAPAVAVGPGFDLAVLLGGGKLAMALVDAVPAGIYGKAALTALGVWDAVAGRVAQTDNVRAALALVARGEAPYGIVYATDAAAEANVTAVAVFPAGSHPPVTYPAAVTAASATPEAADLLEFLSSAAAQAIFARHGFEAPG